MKTAITLSLLFLVTSFYAQELKLEEIMKGEDFIGHSPVNIRWSADGKHIYFDWNPNNEPGNSTYDYDLSKSSCSKVDKGLLSIPVYDDNQVNNVQYSSERGRLIRYNARTGIKTVLYAVEDGVYGVQRVKNPSKVYFLQGTNLYCYSENAGIEQVSNFTTAAPRRESKDSSELVKQQEELFQYVRDQKKAKEWHKANTQEPDFPKAVVYEKDERLENISISPDERFILFRLTKNSEEPDTYFEEFITTDGYTRHSQARSKVREIEPECRFGVYDRDRDTSYFVSFSTLSDIRKRPAYFAEYGKTDNFEKDRNIIMHDPVFNDQTSAIVMDVRSFDNKDRWIVTIDALNGTAKEIEHQHDEAWIGGPGISEWNEAPGVLGWINENTVYYQSEASGYSHLYTKNILSGEAKALTSGKFEIHDVHLSKDKKLFYIIANKLHPGVRNGYKLSVNGGEPEAVFEGKFGIEWVISPDEKHVALRTSSIMSPWSLAVAENKAGAKQKEITKVVSTAFASLKLQTPQIIRIPASDGKEVTARLYIPEKPNGAAVEFVHGAGYLQNAHYFWSNYYREFLFHQLLAQKGYTVLDIDYRASEGYGRDHRTAIYRHMGERELLDYIDGKEYLVKNHNIDADRVGIYGGSYGGFITLMAMMKTPGKFACGAALRSVTDWQHYNHEYTSNILNYPATDPIAYRRSSPIYFAEGLQGPLLILHGMVDDNVQFQDVVRLNQRLIELGKTNYTMAVFPVEAHGFKTASSWTDEYRRILELFEKELKR